MKGKLVTALQYFFFLALGALFVWLSVKDITATDWQHIRYSLQHAKHWLILPALGMLLLSHYLRALRWKILMEPLGHHPTTFNVFASVMVGYLVNAGVPRLGEVVKCTMLAKYEKIRVDKLVGTIVTERAIDMVSLLVVFVLALVFQGHIIGDYVMSLVNNFFRSEGGGFSSQKLLITFFGRRHFLPDCVLAYSPLCPYRCCSKNQKCPERNRSWPGQHSVHQTQRRLYFFIL